MEIFFLKLAVAVIPLVLLVVSVTLVSAISHTHRPLAWQPSCSSRRKSRRQFSRRMS